MYVVMFDRISSHIHVNTFKTLLQKAKIILEKFLNNNRRNYGNRYTLVVRNGLTSKKKSAVGS